MQLIYKQHLKIHQIRLNHIVFIFLLQILSGLNKIISKEEYNIKVFTDKWLPDDDIKSVIMYCEEGNTQGYISEIKMNLYLTNYMHQIQILLLQNGEEK